MKTVVYFETDPKGLMKIVRDAYYYEDKQDWVKDVTQSLNLPWKYMKKVLEGEGIITSIDDKTFMYRQKEDKEWKKELKKIIKYNEEKYIIFAGRRVERKLVDEYATSVVSRLRDVMRHPEMIALMDTMVLYNLEIQRQTMHDAILKSAGFEEDKNSDDRVKFDKELGKYVDEKAGSLINPVNFDDDDDNSPEYLTEKKKAEKAGKLNPPKYR